MEPNNAKQHHVKSTKTAIDLLETIQEMDGARVTELSNQLNLAKSTVHRHVSTLYDCEYLNKKGDEYHIGLRFLSLGEYTRKRESVYQLIEPKIKEMAEKTGERAQFIVEEHGTGVYLFRELGANALKTSYSQVGARFPLHASSAGKAILADIPNNRVQEIIDKKGLSKYTATTITDKEELFEEIDKIKKQEYSINKGENHKDIWGVGVSIKQKNGYPIGGLSISGPRKRLNNDQIFEEHIDYLLGVANELEINISYS